LFYLANFSEELESLARHLYFNRHLERTPVNCPHHLLITTVFVNVKGWDTCEHPEEAGTQRPHVNFLRVTSILRLISRDYAFALEHVRRDRGLVTVKRFHQLTFRIDLASLAEVTDSYCSICLEKHIVKFYIAMHEAEFVYFTESCYYLLEHILSFRLQELFTWLLSHVTQDRA